MLTINNAGAMGRAYSRLTATPGPDHRLVLQIFTGDPTYSDKTIELVPEQVRELKVQLTAFLNRNPVPVVFKTEPLFKGSILE